MLDNRGWGLRKMIVYSCLILSCLLVACYYVNYLYNDLQKSMERSQSNSDVNYEVSSNDTNDTLDNTQNNEIVYDQSYYEDLENDLYTSTESFIIDGYVDVKKDLTTVTSKQLIDDGYLEFLVDQNGNSCSGFSNVFGNENGTYVIRSYITCDEYSTER